MAERLVCTAHPSQRPNCSSNCGGCGYLIAERRAGEVRTGHWANPDRRVMSNWLPTNYQLAGFGQPAAGTSLLSREAVTSIPVFLTALLVTFNLMDSLLTARALSMGFTEANPMMAGLFNLSLPMVMFLKSVIVGIGALFLWKVRYLSLAVRGLSAVTACFWARGEDTRPPRPVGRSRA